MPPRIFVTIESPQIWADASERDACSQPKQPFRILAEQLSLDLPVGRQAADTRDDLGAQTVRSAPVAIVAVAAEKQLVAMPRHEIAREILVARQRVEP